MAVFTEQEIMQSAVPDVGAILENALYLESGSTIITPKTVAVTENSAIQAMVVRFDDVAALSEEYGLSYLNAMSAVAEANDIDPNILAVAVDEAEIIENPDLIGELDHVVINPISDNSPEYKFCEACFDAWLESGDESFLEEFILNERGISINLSNMDPDDIDSTTSDIKAKLGLTSNTGNTPQTSSTTNTRKFRKLSGMKKKPAANGNTTSGGQSGSNFTWKHGLAAVASGAALKGLVHYANKPDSVIARKIAALRNLARKVTTKAQQVPEKRGFFQKVMDKIKEMINRLMVMLHKK